MRYIVIKYQSDYYIIMTKESEELLVVQYINNMRKRYDVNKILNELTSIYDIKVWKTKNYIEVLNK